MMNVVVWPLLTLGFTPAPCVPKKALLLPSFAPPHRHTRLGRQQLKHAVFIIITNSGLRLCLNVGAEASQASRPDGTPRLAPAVQSLPCATEQRAHQHGRGPAWQQGAHLLHSAAAGGA